MESVYSRVHWQVVPVKEVSHSSLSVCDFDAPSKHCTKCKLRVPAAEEVESTHATDYFSSQNQSRMRRVREDQKFTPTY
jgi:hypothetical protein